MENEYDPTDALADVDAARLSVADRLVTPWWYHPALGAIVAAIVLAGALDLPSYIRLPVVLGAALGIGMLVGLYQRMTGLWVDLRNLGPTSRRWWAVYAVIVAVMVGASFIPMFGAGALPLWVALLLAGTTVVATIVLGRLIDHTMRAEIRSGVAALPTPPR